MTQGKQDLVDNKGVDGERTLRKYDKYPEELIECATVRSEKYHILQQKEYEDCIITSYHKIINSEYLDIERELINEKLLSGSKYCEDFQYGKNNIRLYGSESIIEDNRVGSNVVSSDIGIISKRSKTKNGSFLDSESYVDESELNSEYSDSEYKKLGSGVDDVEEDEEKDEEYGEEDEDEDEDEEDEERSGKELLLISGAKYRRNRIQVSDMLNLPNSDYLILRNFPVSFGIPIIRVKKLNIRPILFFWVVVLVSVIYGISIFLDQYVINEIVPLNDIDNVAFKGFGDKSLNTETEMKSIISSLLRSKGSSRSKESSLPSFSSGENYSLLRELFPSFISGSQRSGSNENNHLSVILDLKNCHVQFFDSKSELSYVKIRSWKIFSQSQLYSGSFGRYRLSRRVADKYDYICSYSTFHWIVKRYMLSFLQTNKLEKITWREYREYCDRSSRPWNYVNDSNLHIKLHQSNVGGEYFQCSVNFFLSKEFRFGDLSIKYTPTSSYMRVVSNVPIYAKRQFHIEALHGMFDLKDVHSPNISVSLSDGWSSFSIPDKNIISEQTNVLVESRGAPIYINSKVPLVVNMPVRVAELCVLRSRQVKISLDKKSGDGGSLNHYKSGSFSAKLGSSSLKRASVSVRGTLPPLYVTVNDFEGEDEDLVTWAGRYQLMDPHLFLFSKSRFDSFNKWLQEDLSSPWVLHINILGNDEYPRGTWKAVSSRAFIRDAYGLVLISGGLLKPRTYNLYIHILGLRCLAHSVHSDLEELDVINVDNQSKDGDLNEDSSKDTGLDSESGVSEKGDSAVSGREIFKDIKRQIQGVVGSRSDLQSRDKKDTGGVSGEKLKLLNLKDVFNNKYGSRMLSNNLQETINFGESGVGEINELLPNYGYGGGTSDGVVEREIGSYIGRSGSIRSCESSVTENIFSVINSAIMETAQQPSVIVWTQNKGRNDTNVRFEETDIEKRFDFSIRAIMSNKIVKLFRGLYLLLLKIEGILLPRWIIPGWNSLSRKILKSSILAEDDYNNMDLNALIQSDYYYNDKSNNQFIYTAENDAILRDLVTANDLRGYIVSLILNTFCAVFVATFSMWVLYYYVFPWFLTGIKELQLVSTASHRLNHDFRTSETGEWIVMVTVIQWPEFGLLLRWNQRQKRLDGEKICIYIKQVDVDGFSVVYNRDGDGLGSGERQGECDSDSQLAEFFLYISANEASLTTHFGRNQQELFVPMKYTSSCGFEVTMPYELLSDNKYRLRILRISSNGHIIEQSNWSNEIIPGDKMKFVDFPLLFLRRFMPVRRSSLNLFIDKNTEHCSPFGIPFFFKNIEIIIFDALDGKKKKRNSFSFDCLEEKYVDNDGNSNPEEDGREEGGRMGEEEEREWKRAERGTARGGSVNNSSDENPQGLTEYVGCDGESMGGERRRYLLVATLLKDFESNKKMGGIGISGSVNEVIGGNNSLSSDFNITGISNDDESITSLRSYIFKNKSFDTDRVRIEGTLENMSKYTHKDSNDTNSYSNVFILRNNDHKKRDDQGRQMKEEKEHFDSLYLEQSLISQKRILFELQDADSGQIIANGDVKCSKLIDTAWRSLVISVRENDSMEEKNGLRKSHKASNTDLMQVHDIKSGNTVSIQKYVDMSINLYYVEGGQWGELSMSLDRSFWVQYLRHDLSNEIVVNLDGGDDKLQEKSVILKGEQDKNGDLERGLVKPRFVNDTPGKIVINGSDTQIDWEWDIGSDMNASNATILPKKIYLHLFDHCTDTFLTSLHSERHVPNNGTYAWSVDIPFISQRSSSRDVYLVMSVSIEDVPSNTKIRGRMLVSRSTKSLGLESKGIGTLNRQIIVAVSNSFKVIRLTTLSEFELLYATFCRTFGLEMEVVTYNDLTKYGFHVSKNNLRICENIRKPIPSETNYGGTYCPGQYIVSSKAIAVKTGERWYDFNREERGYGEVEGCGDEKDRVEMENYVFLKSHRKYIDIIENCTLNYSNHWWLSSPDRFLLKNGIVLDTSVFLPITLRIITFFRLDLVVLHVRSFSIRRLVTRLRSMFWRKRCLVGDYNDTAYFEDGSSDKTINISSGLLVHSNFSTVYRRRSTWRSRRSNAWRIMLSFVGLVGGARRKKGTETRANKKSEGDTSVSVTKKRRVGGSISVDKITRSKRRWSNALMSLRMAQLKMSPDRIFNLRRTENRDKDDVCGREELSVSQNRDFIRNKSLLGSLVRLFSRSKSHGYTGFDRATEEVEMEERRFSRPCSVGDGSGYYNDNFSLNLARESDCKYTELSNNIDNGEERLGVEKDEGMKMETKVEDDDPVFYGYNIGYGGILVPLYIAEIKQRQEIVREIWYKLQFSVFPVVLKAVIYGFQFTLLSIFPLTCLGLTLTYNYLSTQSSAKPHTYICEKYISDVVFNPRWDFFMSISFPIPYLILASLLHILIINITFISSNTYSFVRNMNRINNRKRAGRSIFGERIRHYWIKTLVFFEDIGMFITLFSTFLTLLAISMFFLWFLLGSLINSDNILPYVVMLLALGFVVVSLWNNFTSSRGIVDRFIAENLQSLISIALGHWFEATNQKNHYQSRTVAGSLWLAGANNGYSISTDPNDLRSRISDRLKHEILKNRYFWSRSILEEYVCTFGSNENVGLNIGKRNKELDGFLVDGSMELRHSTKISRQYDARSKSLSQSLLNDCCELYCLRWEFMKISPPNPRRLFRLNKSGEVVGVEETMSIYYGMRFATRKDVSLNCSKVDGLLGEFEVALLKDGIRYRGRTKDFSEKDGNSYKYAIVKIPVFPVSSVLSEEAKIKLIFDFFDVDQDGYLSKKEMLQWIINLEYDDRFFINGDNTKYCDILEYMNTVFGLNIDERSGLTVDDLLVIYSSRLDDISIDYNKIIPIFNYSYCCNDYVSNFGVINCEDDQLDSLESSRILEDGRDRRVRRTDDERTMGVKGGRKMENERMGGRFGDLKGEYERNEYMEEVEEEEEEYDEEFGDRIFTSGGNDCYLGNSQRGVSNLSVENSENFVSSLDQKGYLWLDLLSNEDNNIYMRESGTGVSVVKENRMITTDLNNLKLIYISKLNMGSEISDSGVGDENRSVRMKSSEDKGNSDSGVNVRLKRKKYNRFQLLREVNVQKLKYIFTFATRNLRTPEIETALKDIHSLAYKVFDAQIALLIPVFGVNNVLSLRTNTNTTNSILCKERSKGATLCGRCYEDEGSSAGFGERGISGDGKKGIVASSVLNKNTLNPSPSQLLSSFSFSFQSSWNNGGGKDYGERSGHQVVEDDRDREGEREREGAGRVGGKGDGVAVGSEGDTTKFLQLMRILHNEIRQDIWLLFSHILGKLFNNNRVKNGANHFLDTVYPKLVRRKAARIVNIFYGPSLSELSPSIHEYFVSAPPKTAAQVMDALKEYRVENQRNVRETLEIISLSQGNASMQFQVSLITKALYALSLLKDNDVEMLTVDIPWKKSCALIAEEVLILPKNHQGMKLILESIQVVLRRVNSITGGSNSPGNMGVFGESGEGDGGKKTSRKNKTKKYKGTVFDVLDNSLMETRYLEETNNNASIMNNELTEATLEQVIQIIVSKYLWMDSFIFLIRLCGINLSTDRLPSVTYDNSASITNLNYIEERNLEHVKNIFTKLSNGSGFLPVELSDLALLTLTDKCLNFSGLLVSMNFLGLINNNMFLLGGGNPIAKLDEIGFDRTNVINICYDWSVLGDLSSLNVRSKSGFAGDVGGGMASNGVYDDKHVLENLLFTGTGGMGGTVSKMLMTEKTCNYGELLDWTLLSNIKGIPDDIVKDFRSIAILRCGFIGRSQLHDYISQHRRLYINSETGEISKDTSRDSNKEYLEKMTREKENWLPDFNISFDIFDVTLTTLGFSSHKLQSYILWLLLCLNLNTDSIQLFVNAKLARDFIVMLYLQPRYKYSTGTGNNQAEGGGGGGELGGVGGGIGDLGGVGVGIGDLGGRSSAESGTLRAVNSSHKSSVLDLNGQQYKHLDAQDVESYNGYFTFEMLRRFLVLAKITVPENGIEEIWKSLPKDPLNITNFMSPYRNSCSKSAGEGNEDNKSRKEVKITKKRSFGDRFRKGEKKVAVPEDPQSSSGYRNINISSIADDTQNRLKNANFDLESRYLRVLMDKTGMDPMKGVVVNINTIKRLVPKKLMTGLWPEAIKVLLNIGLHLEKSDVSIMEATSRCLEYSNKYGLIKPGDIVSILAALSKEGLSFDLLCELLNNMRIQLPVRDVKRMFDLMDLNQDKSLDLQELLDGFEVLFGLFLPKLVHVHVGLSYERQSIIIIAASTALLLFCAFVGIAIKTFEGMRNELSTAVQSVLAIVGAVGLQTGASKDSSEIEERMKERIEDIMGGDIDTSISQIENNNIANSGGSNPNNMVSSTDLFFQNGTNFGIKDENNKNFVLTEKGAVLGLIYNYSHNKFPVNIPNDPRPCITFYCNDQVYLEPVFYCSKGTISQHNSPFFFEGVKMLWSIKPSLPKFTGLALDRKNGVIKGTIPLYFNSRRRQYIQRNTIRDYSRYAKIINNSKACGGSVSGTGSNSLRLLKKMSNINSSGGNGGSRPSKMAIFKKLSSVSNANSLSGTGGVVEDADYCSDKESSDNNENPPVLMSDFRESDEYLFDLSNIRGDYENCDNTNMLLSYNNQFVYMNKQIFNVYCTINEPPNEKVVYKTRITIEILPEARK